MLYALALGQRPQRVGALQAVWQRQQVPHRPLRTWMGTPPHMGCRTCPACWACWPPCLLARRPAGHPGTILPHGPPARLGQGEHRGARQRQLLLCDDPAVLVWVVPHARRRQHVQARQPRQLPQVRAGRCCRVGAGAQRAQRAVQPRREGGEGVAQFPQEVAQRLVGRAVPLPEGVAQRRLVCTRRAKILVCACVYWYPCDVCCCRSGGCLRVGLRTLEQVAHDVHEQLRLRQRHDHRTQVEGAEHGRHGAVGRGRGGARVRIRRAHVTATGVQLKQAWRRSALPARPPAARVPNPAWLSCLQMMLLHISPAPASRPLLRVSSASVRRACRLCAVRACPS